MTDTVLIPVDDLAAALGSSADDLGPALELAARLGAVRLRNGRVELPAPAVGRLGLFRRADGRWALDPADRGSSDRRVRTLPLLFEEGHADPRAEEPWQEVARAEEPPPDRNAALGRWLDAYSRGQPPPAPGSRPDRAAVGIRPAPTPAPRRTDGTGRVTSGKVQNIDLAALRIRLDAAARAAG